MEGPIGGNLNVSGTVPEMIFRFVYAHKCLGMSNGLANEVDVLTSIPVDKAGSFKFAGKGTLIGNPPKSIPLRLSGAFVTSKLAKLNLVISYRSCKPVKLTLRYPGT
jgi:hypothetical protein